MSGWWPLSALALLESQLNLPACSSGPAGLLHFTERGGQQAVCCPATSKLLEVSDYLHTCDGVNELAEQWSQRAQQTANKLPSGCTQKPVSTHPEVPTCWVYVYVYI